MTILALALITPFLFLFANLWASRFTAHQDPNSEVELKLHREIQAENTAIANSGEPAIAAMVSETWICLWSKMGNYATVGADDKLAIPGLF
jgi:hypothetical protein